MPHETKIAIVVRDDLATWQKLNLAGVAVHDRRNLVDKVLKGLRLHP